MKTLAEIITLLLIFSMGSVQGQNPFCEAEELQINFMQLMQSENLTQQQQSLDVLVLNWENYKCDYLKTPNIPEFFAAGQVDFLVEELISCLERSEKQDIIDASLESIKTLGLLHFLHSDHQNGLSYLAVIGQQFHDVKYVVNDEMLDLYHWMEFKKMVEDLNEEWGRYKHLDYIELSICNDFKSEDVHQALVLQVSNCMEEILACFESAYTPDFKLPCLEMEYSLNKLFAFYGETYAKENETF